MQSSGKALFCPIPRCREREENRYMEVGMRGLLYLNMVIARDVFGGRRDGEASEIPTTGDCGKNDFCGTLQP